MRAAPRATSPARCVPVLVLAIAMATAGCTTDGDEDGADRPGPRSSTTTTETAPTAPPTSRATTSTAPPEPAVAPATGPELRMEVATVRLPDGWELTEGQASFLATGWERAVGSTNFIGLSQFPSLVSDLTPAEIDENALEDPVFEVPPVLQEPAVLDGVEMRHVSGSGYDSVTDLFVALVDGDLVTLTVTLNATIPEAERLATVESVAASLRWT